MAVTALITITESDAYNTLSADWVVLSDALKTAHIFNASVYMQANWSCANVTWSDTSTLDDDLKRACAYYADADRLGVLTDAIAVTEKHGRIIEETGKLGSMGKTVKWADSGALTSGNPLQSIDTMVKLYCTSISGTMVRA
jgi:hypothetical protein